MGMSRGRRCTRGARRVRGGDAGTALIGAAPAPADAGKVLVFTGTAGTASTPPPRTRPSAIQALGAANDFTVDVTTDATKINAANLAGYRAVVFVQLRGRRAQRRRRRATCRPTSRAAAASSASARPPSSRRATPLLRHADRPHRRRAHDREPRSARRTSSSSTACIPATRDDPLLSKGRTDNYYRGPTTRRARSTPSRACASTDPSRRARRSAAVGHQRRDHALHAARPTRSSRSSERALSWCRDVQQGRSFYTGLGETAARLRRRRCSKHLARRHPVGRGHGPRQLQGDDHVQLHADAPDAAEPDGAQPSRLGDTHGNFNPYMGEIDALAMAEDGRVFYAGRAVCFQGQPQFTNWDAAERRPRLRHDPRVGSERRPGSIDQNPAKVTKVADCTVFGAKGGGIETGATSKDRAGHPRHRPRPGLHHRPPVHLRPVPPVLRRRAGQATRATDQAARPGLRPRRLHGRAPPVALHLRRATKTLVPGSEKVIHHWMTQVFSCCHLGGSMDFDSKGNLYFATGDNTGNAPNSQQRRLHQRAPEVHDPVPDVDGTYEGTAAAWTRRSGRCGTHASRARDTAATRRGSPAAATSATRRAPDLGQHERLRGQAAADPPAGQPAANDPGIGTTYTIPGADAPNGAEPVPAGQPGRHGRQGQARGLRDGRPQPVLDRRRLQDRQDRDRVGRSRPGHQQHHAGARPRPRTPTIMNSAGNYGWPYCQAATGYDYRAKLPSTTGGGTAANLGRQLRGTVGGGADGQTRRASGTATTRQAIANDSPFNTGLERDPGGPKPTNIWYGPQGGCYDFPRNANGVPIYNGIEHDAPARTTLPPLPVAARWQPGADDGRHLPQAGRRQAPNAWPAYWDGRWFLADFAGGNNLRHALLMDPATEFTGGQPVAADSLYGIIPTGADEQQPHHRPGLRSRRRAVRGRLRRIELHDQQRQHRRLALRLRRRRRHPGSRPAGRRRTRTRARRSRSTSASPVASRTSGTSPTAARATGETVTPHVPDRRHASRRPR